MPSTPSRPSTTLPFESSSCLPQQHQAGHAAGRLLREWAFTFPLVSGGAQGRIAEDVVELLGGDLKTQAGVQSWVTSSG